MDGGQRMHPHPGMRMVDYGGGVHQVRLDVAACGSTVNVFTTSLWTSGVDAHVNDGVMSTVPSTRIGSQWRVASCRVWALWLTMMLWWLC